MNTWKLIGLIQLQLLPLCPSWYSHVTTVCRLRYLKHGWWAMIHLSSVAHNHKEIKEICRSSDYMRLLVSQEGSFPPQTHFLHKFSLQTFCGHSQFMMGESWSLAVISLHDSPMVTNMEICWRNESIGELLTSHNTRNCKKKKNHHFLLPLCDLGQVMKGESCSKWFEPRSYTWLWW